MNASLVLSLSVCLCSLLFVLLFQNRSLKKNLLGILFRCIQSSSYMSVFLISILILGWTCVS